MEKLHTPDLPGIDEVAKHLKTKPNRLLKAIAFDVDGELGLAIVPGNREVNEFALGRAVPRRRRSRLLTDADFAARPGPAEGLHRPGLRGREARGRRLVGPGAAPLDHRRERDRPPRRAAACSDATSRPTRGSRSRSSSPATRARAVAQPLRIDRGIEVGHVFQLGTKYTEALGAPLHRRARRAAPDGHGLLRHRREPHRRRGRRGAPRRQRDWRGRPRSRRSTST